MSDSLLEGKIHRKLLIKKLGIRDGKLFGIFEGNNIGKPEGWNDGSNVGKLDGMIDGTLEGTSDGSIDEKSERDNWWVSRSGTWGKRC